jgi:hypothetical protein
LLAKSVLVALSLFSGCADGGAVNADAISNFQVPPPSVVVFVSLSPRVLFNVP